MNLIAVIHSGWRATLAACANIIHKITMEAQNS